MDRIALEQLRAAVGRQCVLLVIVPFWLVLAMLAERYAGIVAAFLAAGAIFAVVQFSSHLSRTVVRDIAVLSHRSFADHLVKFWQPRPLGARRERRQKDPLLHEPRDDYHSM